jgi:hypothetical protein
MKIWFRIEVRQSGARPSDASSSATMATAPLPTQPASPEAAPDRKKSREIAPIFESGHTTSNRLARRALGEGFTFRKCISNRFWPKNRCYRKQKTKACLTGSRIAIKDFRISTILHPQACRKSRESISSSVLYQTLESNPSASLTKCKNT